MACFHKVQTHPHPLFESVAEFLGAGSEDRSNILNRDEYIVKRDEYFWKGGSIYVRNDPSGFL